MKVVDAFASPLVCALHCWQSINDIAASVNHMEVNFGQFESDERFALEPNLVYLDVAIG